MVRTIISFRIFILFLSVNLNSLDTSFLHACTSTLRKPISNGLNGSRNYLKMHGVMLRNVVSNKVVLLTSLCGR